MCAFAVVTVKVLWNAFTLIWIVVVAVVVERSNGERQLCASHFVLASSPDCTHAPTNHWQDVWSKTFFLSHGQ